MAITNTILLKGLLGVTACVGSAAITIANKDKIVGYFSKSKEDKKTVTNTDGAAGGEKGVNNGVKTTEETEDNLGFPKSCGFGDSIETPKECELDKGQLEKVKFEGKENGTVTITGLTGENKVKVTVSKETDTTTFTKGKKYTFKSDNEQVKISNLKGDKEEVTLEKGGKEIVFKEVNEGNKLEYVPMVDELGIPKRCEASKVDSTTTSKECQLTEGEIKEIKFKDFTDGKTVVSGVSDSNKVTLKIEHSSDTTTYPTGKKYTFSVGSSKVTISNPSDGQNSIAIEKGKDVEFAEKSKKLERVPTEDKLGIPKKECKPEQVTSSTQQSCQLTADQLKNIKFEAKNNGSISVEGLDNSKKVTLTITDVSSKEGEKEIYTKGKKYSFKTTDSGVKIKGIKDNDLDLTQNKEFSFKENDQNKLEYVPDEDSLGIPTVCLSSKVNSTTTKKTCELTEAQLKNIKFEAKDNGSIAVEGLSDGKKVTLTISYESDANNYPNNKKYSFKATDSGVKIKNTKDNDVELTQNKDIDFKESSGKLVKVEEKKEETEDKLGIPKTCQSEQVNATTTSKTCQLTKDQMEKIKFETNGSSSITMEGLENNKKVTLTITYESNATTYPKNKKYSFKATDENVKIKGTKDKDIELTKGQDIEFKESSDGSKLEKVSGN